MTVKERKIRKTDWDKVGELVQSIYDERKKSNFRREHEEKWSEIDRQIAMNPMKRVSEQGKEIGNDWRSALELGELSKASEIITSDVMRITFPTEKVWFQPHVYLSWPTDPKTGKPKSNSEKQKVADGILRNLMSQQHQDFGFKSRFRLSVKESLHHGSFVAETRFEKELMVKDGGMVKSVGSPVWVPYSMWNAYPDPSPSVIGANMFYTGSMVLVDYMPLAKLKRLAKSDGWMEGRLSKVEEQEHDVKGRKTKDVELVKYYGDISIERADGDIYLPNAKVILANGELVYYAQNELPYPSVIYGGYERQDVRDPYYTSPIIKQSPMQKFATVMVNKFADGVGLKIEPPIEYDGNDPDYVQNDGPVIAPGAKTPTKSMGKGMTVIDIGDPSYALKAAEVGLRNMQEGTGVSALRSGTANSDRQTAFEVNKVAQGAEVRTIEFVDQLSPGLRSFLHMQHELNRMHMTEYEFYNDEMHTPDVIRAKKSDIQANACFEVVGSRGLLGEEQRTQKTTQVTAFASQNPLFANLLKPDQVLLDMYRDAGKKNPEEWVKAAEQNNPQDAAKDAQMQQMGQMLQQLQGELQKEKEGNHVKLRDIESKERQAAEAFRLEQKQFMLDQAKAAAEQKQAAQELYQKAEEARNELAETHRKNNLDFQTAMEKIQRDYIEGMAGVKADLEKTKQAAKEKPAKRKVKRVGNGEYEID